MFARLLLCGVGPELALARCVVTRYTAACWNRKGERVHLYLMRRLLYATLLLFLASTAIFFLLRALPNGPFDRIQVERAEQGKKPLSQGHMDRLNSLVGLTMPVHEQYAEWIQGIMSGDLGYSWAVASTQSVRTTVLTRVPYTLLLMLAAIVLALLVAVPAGIYSALHPYTDGDMALTMLSFFGLSMPPYWFGLLLISVFSLGLNWLPSSGVAGRDLIEHGDILSVLRRLFTLGLTNKQAAGYETQIALDGLKHLILPAITLSLVSIARWSRFVRAALLEVLGADYVRAAQAYGVPKWRLLIHHALRNGLVPLITVMALDIPALFTGTIIVEIVFAWPGIGRLYLDALKIADWPLIQGLLIVNTLMILGANLLADVAYALVDPRIRYS